METEVSLARDPAKVGISVRNANTFLSSDTPFGE